MKRLIIAIALTVVAFLACLGENLLINNYYNDITKNIDKCKTAISQGDFKKAGEESENIEKKWQKREEKLTFFVSKKHMQDISLAVSQLKELATEDSEDEFLALCEQIEFLLNNIKNDEKFSFTGIL